MYYLLVLMDQPINPTQNNTQEQPKEEMHEETLEELSQRREKEIKTKRVLFNKIKIIASILIITSIGIFTTYVIYERQRSTAPVTPVVTSIEQPKEPEIPVNTWELHRDDDLKVFVKIPPEAKLFAHTNPTKIEIVYSKAESDFSKITEQNLADGYIFRITPMSLGSRDLAKVAAIKQESYRVQCPSTATISEATDTLVDTIDAKRFSVNNCNVDFIVTYIPRFGIFYEVAQIYKGDVGIGQQYLSKTQELLSSLRFFPDDSPKPYEPFITYYNEDYNFSIKYPDNMDMGCCSLLGPTLANKAKDNPENKIITGVYVPTYKDKNTFDGFTLYLIPVGPRESTSFDKYVNDQKIKLAEDFKVVTGSEPNVSSEDITVNGNKGYLLKGYHWQGSTLAFFNVSAGRRSGYAVIVLRNLSGDTNAQKILDDILNSFEFFPKLTK